MNIFQRNTNYKNNNISNNKKIKNNSEDKFINFNHK